MTASKKSSYTDESELICWHWDHCFNRNVKGINFLTGSYRTPNAAFPVAFELIQKSDWTTDKKTGKVRRVCPKTKNEYLREMVAQCQKNQLPFRKDGSQGVVYLVTSDTTLSGSDIQTIYQKRWKVEEYHKLVKSNTSFAKSLTKTLRTQSNPIFACLWAYVKLESLRLKTRLNHFAMKGRLYKAAFVSAYRELQLLKGMIAPA